MAFQEQARTHSASLRPASCKIMNVFLVPLSRVIYFGIVLFFSNRRSVRPVQLLLQQQAALAARPAGSTQKGGGQQGAVVAAPGPAVAPMTVFSSASPPPAPATVLPRPQLSSSVLILAKGR